MSRTLTADTIAQMQQANTSAVLPVLIHIKDSATTPAFSLYFCNNLTDLVYDGNTYVARAFEYTPPSESASKVGRGKLVIDNVDRTLTAYLRNVTSPPIVEAIASFWFDEGSSVVFEPMASWDMEMDNLFFDVYAVTCDLVYDAKLDNGVPYLTMTPSLFPGVH